MQSHRCLRNIAAIPLDPSSVAVLAAGSMKRKSSAVLQTRATYGVFERKATRERAILDEASTFGGRGELFSSHLVRSHRRPYRRGLQVQSYLFLYYGKSAVGNRHGRRAWCRSYEHSANTWIAEEVQGKEARLGQPRYVCQYDRLRYAILACPALNNLVRKLSDLVGN